MDILYSIAQTITDFVESSPSLIWSLVAIVAVTPPVVLVHELGHALMARHLTGVDPEIALGRTGKIAEIELARIRVDINAVSNPLGPAASVTFDAREATARDILLIAIAGPIASLAALVPTIILLDAAAPGTVLHGLVWAATLIGVGGVLNLIPVSWTEGRNALPMKSDGRVALDALAVERSIR